MIDQAFQNLVFTELNAELEKRFPGVSVYGDYVEIAQTFPCVSVLLDNDFPARKFISTTESEYATDVHFTINSYSESKAESQDISDCIDQVMTEMRFCRSSHKPMPNFDRTIYRITSEYIGRVVKTESNGDTVFHVFGRQQ